MAAIHVGILLIYLYILSPTHSTSDYETVRMCNNDYKTPGRCFVSVNETLSWQAADEHCQNYLPRSGYLASIEDATSQSLVAAEVLRRGWEQAWINGQLNDNIWLWQKHWSYLSFQGCWNDDPTNPDLPIILPVTADTKPSECLDMCEVMAGNNDWYHLGIQKDAEGKLVCRCNRQWTKKHGRSYNSSCYDPCPGSSIFRGGDVIDKYCGSYGNQLIYFVKGTKFHAFGSSSPPSNNHCVVMDPGNNYMWTEHDCHDPQPFICQYESSEENCIQHRSYKWANGACVTLEMEPLSFYKAMAFCYKYRGNLLKVETADVHEAVKGLLDNVHMYYIALTNQDWIFSYWGIVFRYYNWGPGQPSDGTGQDCLMMKRDADYKWHNIDCQSPLPFICMVDIKEEKSTTMTTSTELTTMSSNDTGTTSSKKDDKTSEGFYRGLSIGIGAGAGGAIFVFIFVTLCICCYFRQREKVMENKQQTSDHISSNQKPPLPQSREFTEQPMSNSGQSPLAQQSLNEPTYLEVEKGDYEELDRGSYHEYTDIQTKEYDYLEPTPNSNPLMVA